ncbi:MAG: alpha/beta hydrolase [Bacteroidetes bacterium]|nr:alpha/beta hydrolase [Bacteroidota bacterium]
MEKQRPLSQADIFRLRESCPQAHYLIPTDDQQNLFLRLWEAPTVQKSVAVLIFHGITAHSGAYARAGEVLSQRGIPCFGLDYRGHGLSDGNRGDNPGRDRWIADLKEALSFVKNLGFEKVIVLGHSLGVAAAIYLTKASPDSIDGLILLSGAYKAREGVQKKPGFFERISILISSVFRPAHPVIKYYREGMTGLDDPLFNFSYTLRFLRMLNVKELKLPADLDVPVLVGVGAADELFTVEKVRELYEDVPVSDKTFVVLEGAKHAYFPDESWEVLIKWIKQKYQ